MFDISVAVTKLFVEDCHLFIMDPAVRPVTVNVVLLIPEQTVVSGPTDPFKGIPNVKGVSIHLLEFAALPLTEANLVTVSTPGLFASHRLYPMVPKGILNSKNEPPLFVQPVELPL